MTRNQSILALMCLFSLTSYEAGAEAAAETGAGGGLMLPLACTLGSDCWIARYADHDPGEGVKDYMCGDRTQDGHKGTDFVLADMGHLQDGVAVVATRAGTVLRLRDGVPDISVKERGGDAIKGQECGNAVIVGHDDGSESQYCHLKAGSLKVKGGERVDAGQALADVGLSGQTEYPHLHYMLRREGRVIDTFGGAGLDEACHASGASLWRDTPSYRLFELLPLQFSAAPRSMKDIWQVPAVTLSRSSPALVVTARAFGVHQGDTWHFRIRDPHGRLVIDKRVEMKTGKQFYFQFVGKKRPAEGFLPGRWTATVEATRPGLSGAGPKVVQEAAIEVTAD